MIYECAAVQGIVRNYVIYANHLETLSLTHFGCGPRDDVCLAQT